MSLGIYYLSYSEVPFPKSKRQLIIGYTRDDMLTKIADKNIPVSWSCYYEECRTPGFLVQGNIETIKAWITEHMPITFGEPLVFTEIL